MSRAGTWLAVITLLSARASALGAQSVSMRVGGVHARYADSVSATAGAIGLLGTWETPSFRLGADATYSQFSGGGGATQGSVNGAWVRPVGAAAGLGFQGAFTGSVLSNGVSAWTGTTQAFVAATGTGWLAVAGVSAGTARTVASVREGIYGTAIRLRRDAGPVRFEASAAATWAGRLRFTDLTGGVTWLSPGGALRVGALAGARVGDLSGKPLLQAHGELLVPGAAGVAIEGAIGRYPEDVTGFTSGVFANLGLRIPLSRSASAAAAHGLPGTPARRSVTVEAGDSGRILVTVELPNANTAAIAGEWNAWNPVPMTRVAENRWQVQLPLGPGTWRFAVVVDDDRWIVPPGVPKLPDGFGGEVGVLVIRS